MVAETTVGPVGREKSESPAVTGKDSLLSPTWMLRTSTEDKFETTRKIRTIPASAGKSAASTLCIRVDRVQMGSRVPKVLQGQSAAGPSHLVEIFDRSKSPTELRIVG